VVHGKTKEVLGTQFEVLQTVQYFEIFEDFE
jgi:hypothetical protein